MAKVAVVGTGCQAQSCSLYNAGVAQRPITTTEDQSATFIELFFDLVFVYAVTQTVSLAHEDLSWAGVGHAVVVFGSVGWSWTQYTWALNSADTTHPAVDAVMLVATAIAFLMAVTIPEAFGDAGGWFAATYIAVRVVGLGLYSRVAWDDVAKRTAVRRFAVLSLGGLAAVAAGGVVGGEARAWWWRSWRWRRPVACGGATSSVPNPPSTTPYGSAAAPTDPRWRETCKASGTFHSSSGS